MSVLAARLIAGGVLAAENGQPTYESHSWILPETEELIWGSLAFFVIFALLLKFALPPLRAMFAARTERIAKEITQATNARRSAEQAAAEIRQQLGDLEGERQRLLAEADAQAEQLLVDGRARIETEAAELEAKAEADLAAGQTRLGSELQAEVAAIAAAATERLVLRELDEATQRQLVEHFIARVGAAR
jgi:F-type H+-transporting ATPase subunit b